MTPHATCSYAYGHAPAIGPHTGKRCWPLLPGVWRAIAPLMQPWCAEGDLPTAANLNLYRGWNSCVGWHCDDEPLFGEYGDAKLIVSVSLGNFAVFRWRRQSCPPDEGHSCRLDHGDHVRTSFFIVRIPVACCLPACAQGSSVLVMGNAVDGVFWAFGFLLGVLCIWGVLVLLGSLLFARHGLLRCASCWTRPLGGGGWRH